MPALRLVPLVRAALPALVLAGCSAGGDHARTGAPRDAARPAALVDDAGDTVRLAATPRRIVSHNPATTESLFAIGAGPRVVGRTHWDEYPAAARAVPDLGDGMRPNVEAVLAARPDLVVLYASPENRPAAERLRAAGVPVFVTRDDRVRDFPRVTAALGRLTGDSARARLTSDTVLHALDAVRAATAALPKPTVAWHVWDDPLIVIGGGSFLGELVEVAGGRNVYADRAESSPQVSLEDVMKRDPDVILAGPASAPRILADPRWAPLRAVREHRVFTVDTVLTGRPSVRMGEAARHLARLLHPGAALP